MTRPAAPDFIIIGAPKAGTTALHAALARHPEVFISAPKEPKYWLCDDAPPPALAAPATRTPSRSGSGAARTTSGCSTPAPARPCAARARRSTSGAAAPSAGSPRQLPDARLVAVVRDPIDRAYSQLDAPVVRRARARGGLRGRLRPEHERIATGWAPFWRYRELGPVRRAARRTSSATSTASGCWCCATATIVDDPRGDRRPGVRVPRHRARARCGTIPRDNSRSFVEPGSRPAVLGPAVRAGAAARRSSRRPQVWRRASQPLVRAAAAAAGDATPPAARARAARAAAARLRRRHRRCSSRSPGRASTTGSRPRAAGSFAASGRSATVAAARSARRSVTRSCAPSARAAST